jgi:hypothetical protein
MTYYIWRGDPASSPPPGNNPALTVSLAADDRAMVTLGAKQFNSSDLAMVGRAEQERRVGTRSNGRFGDVFRVEPSHGKTLNIGFDGIELEDGVFEELDQYTLMSVADLIFARQLIVSQDSDRTNAGAYIDPATIRAL